MTLRQRRIDAKISFDRKRQHLLTISVISFKILNHTLYPSDEERAPVSFIPEIILLEPQELQHQTIEQTCTRPVVVLRIGCFYRNFNRMQPFITTGSELKQTFQGIDSEIFRFPRNRK